METIPTRAIPAFADVAPENAGSLSVALLEEWTSGERSLKHAEELLAPFRREGIVGASDTSGLSKLTQQRDLLEVLWMVSQPKQILYAVGTGIGGKPIGLWVADNTEMFYPSSIAVDVVVDAMIETQARIAERAHVAIGICLHAGVFYDLAGGLHGADAQAVEVLAEDYAHAAEILVTGGLMERVGAGAGAGAIGFERRGDLDGVHAPGCFHLRSGRRSPALREDDYDYPHGFPGEFFGMLKHFEDRTQRERIIAHLSDAHQKERFVVFVARERTRHAAGDLAAILDDFVQDAALRAIIGESADGSNVAESGGGFAILVFESGRDALDVARAIRDKCGARSPALGVKVGIDQGSLLLFRKPDGGYENIAGDPVNLASKISEDLGEVGKINVTERAIAAASGAGGVVSLEGAKRFEVAISGVSIRGVTV